VSTELEPKPTKQPDNFGVLERRAPTKLEFANAQLAQDLQKEKDDRKEERFGWVFAAIILLDMAVLPHLPGIVLVPILPLEVLFLIYMAKRCGIDWIVVYLDHLFRRFSSKKDDD